MRIVQVAESLEVGGAERVVVDLSNLLADRHDVAVVCMQRTGQLAGQLSPGIALQCLDKSSGNDLRAPVRLAALLRRLEADVIHTHHWGIFLDGVAAGLLAGVPAMVHTVHGRYMPYAPGVGPALKKAARHALERLAIRYCRHVVCVSAALTEHIREEVGIPGRVIHIIPNGVRVESPERSGTHPGEAFTFVAVGRLAPVKNLPMLIGAFALACRQRPGLRLRIVGDGPERGQLEQLAIGRGVDASVEFLGFRADVDAILREGDVFVLSSLSEGSPMAILEAMRSRLPVLATRVGGVPAMVADGQTGLLVASGDEAAMATAMVRLADQPGEAARMGEAGYRVLRERFSIDAMAAAYEAIYRVGK